MQFELNQPTRLYYDKDESNLHTINSEKPLKYHSEFSQSRYFNTPLSIDTSNNLRAQPTRLNEIDVPSTDLYGTAPLKLRTGPIDVESGLLQGDTNHAKCGKHTVEEHPFFENHVRVPTDMYPVKVENTVRGGTSTRNTYKNTQILNQ
jgi:hypothetical protein